MNNKQQYQCFLAALRWYIDDGGHGSKAHIGKNVGVSSSFIGQISKPDATKKALPEVQENIAIFLRGSFEEFIKFGAAILKIPMSGTTQTTTPLTTHEPEKEKKLKRENELLNELNEMLKEKVKTLEKKIAKLEGTTQVEDKKNKQA